jgi:hypothetical protein
MLLFAMKYFEDPQMGQPVSFSTAVVSELLAGIRTVHGRLDPHVLLLLLSHGDAGTTVKTH